MDEMGSYALGSLSRDISRVYEEKAVAVAENVMLRKKVAQLEQELKALKPEDSE